MTTLDENRNGPEFNLAGMTVYCTPEFMQRWNAGDVDDDWGNLHVIVPTRHGRSYVRNGEVVVHDGLPTTWEGSLADAVVLGLIDEADTQCEMLPAT